MTAVTPNQERYLLAETASTESYFVSIWFPFNGRVDRNRLEEALRSVVADHPACRTGFLPSIEFGYASVVYPEPLFHVHLLQVETIGTEQIARETSKVLTKISNFSDPAKLQAYFLIEAADGGQALVFSQHHAISDGRSLDLFVTEVAAHYNGVSSSRQAAIVPAMSDPAAEARAAAYFADKLKGNDAPVFHRDLGRAPSRMAACSLVISAELSADIQAIATASSPFSILAAAFAAQVHAQTAVDPVLFSIQSGGRSASERQSLGSFSNALPISLSVDQAESFAQLVQRIRTAVRGAVSHEALPYHRIQSVTGVKADFALNLYPDAPVPAFAGLVLGERRFLPSPSEYGVNMRWQRHLRDGAPVYEAEVYFDAGAIDPARIKNFLARQKRLLLAAVADPDASVGTLLQRSRIASPPVCLPEALPTPRLYEAVERVAERSPDRAAIRHDGETLSYAALWQRVERRAAALALIGVVVGDRVAFIEARGPTFVEMMLALSRLGAIFSAFDPGYPMFRLEEQAEAFRPGLVVTSDVRFNATLDALRSKGWRSEQLAGIDTEFDLPRPPAAGPTDIAYCLLTSGTTGRPRVVGVGHAALPAFVSWQRENFGIGEGDRVTMLSGLSHDPVMRDVLMPLGCGATLLIPAEDMMQNPRALIAWLQHEMPSVLHATPPLGRMLAAVSEDQPSIPSARWIFWGGDMLPGGLVGAFANANPALEQVNFYGSTETPQAVAFHRCTTEDRLRAAVPVGLETGLTGMAVIDASGNSLDVNEVGEVRIDTPYHVVLGDPSQYQSRSPSGQTYATGDRGYRLSNGSVMLVGRKDDQIKVRGYRVELGDVARHLQSLDGVRDAVVLGATTPDGEQQLVAHVVPTGSEDGADFARDVRSRLARLVPTYMVPARVLVHNALPLLANGKIDRAALGAVDSGQPLAAPKEATVAPGQFSVGERRIADIFQALVNTPVASPKQSFTDLGADSLNSIQAMLRLEALLPHLPDDWHERSITDLAGRLSEGGPTPNKGPLALLRTVKLDPTVVLRAVAITLIVAFHFKLLSVGGGLTFILFLVAGVAFARFQLSSVLASGSTQTITRGLIKIAIISFPIGLAMGSRRIIAGIDGGWRMIAFGADFIDFASLAQEQRLGVWLWFIGCYLQLFLFLVLLLRRPAVRRLLASSRYHVLLYSFLAAAALRFVLPALFSPGGLAGLQAMSVWSFLPTAHAGTFLLGALIESTLPGSAKRFWVLGLGTLYALATAHVFPGNGFVLLVAAVLLIGTIRSIPIPWVAAQVSLLVSQASLYIYLLHAPLRSILERLGLGSPLLALLATIPLIIAAAILFDRLYDRLVTFGARASSRRKVEMP